jgi:hypothetical protein
VKTIQNWRQQREAKLRAEDGWLTLTGLSWLQEGRNELPLGTFELRQGKVYHHGKEMRPDVPGPPDVRASGSLRFHILKRGERYGVRIRDVNHPRRREHPPLEWFPVREAYRVEGRWVAHTQPRQIAIPNVLGETERQDSPGYAVFRLSGRELRLAAVVDEGELFFIFKDLTAGHETYPAGRFLYASMPRDGVVELDFNKAYNPPCAVTPYATCPLPPAENRLSVRVEAGEKYSQPKAKATN